MYYLRTKPAAQPIQITVDKTKMMETKANGKVVEDSENDSYNMKAIKCSLDNRDECLMCGS